MDKWLRLGFRSAFLGHDPLNRRGGAGVGLLHPQAQWCLHGKTANVQRRTPWRYAFRRQSSPPKSGKA
jgi:hypothetical protein